MDPRSGGYIGDIEASADASSRGSVTPGAELRTSVTGDEAHIGWEFGSRAGIVGALLSGTEAGSAATSAVSLDGYSVLDPPFIILQHGWR